MGGNLPPLHPSLFTLNVKNFVTTVLTAIEDYLSWGTQFSPFLLPNNFVDFMIALLKLHFLQFLTFMALNNLIPRILFGFDWINLVDPSYLLLFHLNYSPRCMMSFIPNKFGIGFLSGLILLLLLM